MNPEETLMFGVEYCAAGGVIACPLDLSFVA